MKVHHIGYLVKDIEKAYEKFRLLGYTKESETVYDDYRGINISFIVNGNERIELIEPVAPDSVAGGLLKKYKNCAYHICYETDDLDAEIRRLTENGAVQMDSPHEAVALGNRRVTFFMFASMGIIELLEG